MWERLQISTNTFLPTGFAVPSGNLLETHLRTDSSETLRDNAGPSDGHAIDANSHVSCELHILLVLVVAVRWHLSIRDRLFQREKKHLSARAVRCVARILRPLVPVAQPLPVLVPAALHLVEWWRFVQYIESSETFFPRTQKVLLWSSTWSKMANNS